MESRNRFPSFAESREPSLREHRTIGRYGVKRWRPRWFESILLATVAALAPSFAEAQGRITTVAGSTGILPPSANGGLAVNAPLLSVTGVAADAAGNVFV